MPCAEYWLGSRGGVAVLVDLAHTLMCAVSGRLVMGGACSGEAEPCRASLFDGSVPDPSSSPSGQRLVVGFAYGRH